MNSAYRMEDQIPTVAIVGRPNVGKSTLFNRITRSRSAIVEDRPGVTIDRNYGLVEDDEYKFWLIDTGGFEPDPSSELFAKMKAQTELALDEADAIIFLLDGREGLMPDDYTVADMLRRSGKPVLFAVNKLDNQKQEEQLLAEFYQLGIDEIFPVSSAHGRGIADLLSKLEELLPQIRNQGSDEVEEGSDQLPSPNAEQEANLGCRIAVLGRPNAGKSTLINSILGKQRVVVDDTPGTTRDSIDVPFERDGKQYVLVDTAGVRKRARINDFLEKLTVMRALKSVERSDVVILVLDATEPATDQDARIAGFAERRGKAMVIAVNKWDITEKDISTSAEYEEYIRKHLYFVSYAPILFISALTGRRVGRLMEAVDEVYANASRRISTSKLNTWLEKAQNQLSPPVVRHKRIKMFFATQVGTNPPTIVIKTNTSERIPENYKRYLIGSLRREFRFEGTPVRLLFRQK